MRDARMALTLLQLCLLQPADRHRGGVVEASAFVPSLGRGLRLPQGRPGGQMWRAPATHGWCSARRCNVLLLRASGSEGPEDARQESVVGYPEKTVAAVRRELAQRKLQCPFPFATHAHNDQFGALLERLLLDGRWPDKYDKGDRERANKQARLDTAMWAVQHAARLQLAREQIQAVAKIEPGADHDAWRIVADQHGLRITIVEVRPRNRNSFSVDWTVEIACYEPADATPAEDDPRGKVSGAHAPALADIVLVHSAGRYWSTAAIASMSTGLEDDWMPKSLRTASQLPAPGSPKLAQGNNFAPAAAAAETGSPPRGPLFEAQDVASWPPPLARKSASINELHVRDNITAVGRSKRAGSTWKLSQDVERAFNPELVVEEGRRKQELRLAQTRKVRNFTGYGVSDETLRQVEIDWHQEVDTLQATLAQYNSGTMSSADFAKWYRGHFRRQFLVPEDVRNQTLPRVRDLMKREYGIDFRGVPLDGYTGVDRFFDKQFYIHRGRRQREQAATIDVESDVYRAVRDVMDSPVFGHTFINAPNMEMALRHHIDEFFEMHDAGLGFPIHDESDIDVERLARVRDWLHAPIHERGDLLDDIIRPDAPGSLLRSVNISLTQQEEVDVERRFARLPAQPTDMTHVEAAFRLDFPTEQSVIDHTNSKPAWFHTDDAVMEHGRLKRMNHREMAKYVFEQTVRDWDLHQEFRRSCERCGLEGQDLIDRLSMLPPRWKPQLADGRPVPVLCWRPPQWDEFLDPSLVQWLDEHDAMSSGIKTLDGTGDPDARDDRMPLEVLDHQLGALPQQLDALAIGIEHPFDEISQGLSTDSDDVSEHEPSHLPSAESATQSSSQGDGADRGAEESLTGGGTRDVLQPSGARRASRGASKGTGPQPARRKHSMAYKMRRGGPPLCATSGASHGVEPPDWDDIWSQTPSPGSKAAPRVSRMHSRTAPDWLTDPEARQAIEEGAAWLDRDASGWFLVRDDMDAPRALMPGADFDAQQQALDESRMLGDDDAWRYIQVQPDIRPSGRHNRLTQQWHSTLVIGEWKSVRLEVREEAAISELELALYHDEFWLEPDEYDKALLAEGMKSEQFSAQPAQLDLLEIDQDEGQDTSLADQADEARNVDATMYTAEEARQRNSYFKTMDDWISAKTKGRIDTGDAGGRDEGLGIRKTPVNRSLLIDESHETLVRDLRDGAFGKSIYWADSGVWALDDREGGRRVRSSDLARLITVAETYGWAARDNLLRRASLRTYSLRDYLSFRFEPPLTDDETGLLAGALKQARIRFAYAPDTEHRPGVLLLMHQHSAEARVVLERALPSRSWHEAEYQAFIPLDDTPPQIHNDLCGCEYGEVQFWQTRLPPPRLPPLGNLLSSEDQHAWLVPTKFCDWLEQDLVNAGWRTVEGAAGEMEHNKVLVTGEWVSLRLLGGKPADDVHQELVSGRFGSVSRLGDLMLRPSPLDYDLSMLMKDVYMIPKERVEEVLAWLEPGALEDLARDQQLQAEVAALKAVAAATAESRRLESPRPGTAAERARPLAQQKDAPGGSERQDTPDPKGQTAGVRAAFDSQDEKFVQKRRAEEDLRRQQEAAGAAEREAAAHAQAEAAAAANAREQDKVRMEEEERARREEEALVKRQTELDEERQMAVETELQAETEAQELERRATEAREQELAQEEAARQSVQAMQAAREQEELAMQGTRDEEDLARAAQEALEEERRMMAQGEGMPLSSSAPDRGASSIQPPPPVGQLQGALYGPHGAPAEGVEVAGSGGEDAVPAGLGALGYAVKHLDPSWRQVLQEEFESPYFTEIAKILRAEVKLIGATVYPTPDLIFNAFDSTPFDQVKVVVLGQDPYHGAGQASGSLPTHATLKSLPTHMTQAN